jgi:hypothetical protein
VTVPQLILQAGEPEDLAGRGPWLAEDDRAHGLQKRVHVLQRLGACDVNSEVAGSNPAPATRKSRSEA